MKVHLNFEITELAFSKKTIEIRNGITSRAEFIFGKYCKTRTSTTHCFPNN